MDKLNQVLVQLNLRQQFTQDQVKQIYTSLFIDTNFDLYILRKLEQASYLETALIIDDEHQAQLYQEQVFTFIALINIKYTEQINIWEQGYQKILPQIFEFLTNVQQSSLTLQEKIQQSNFLMILFAYPEITQVSKICLRYVSAALLIKTNKIYLKHHFLKFPKLIQSFIEVNRIKGIQNSKEATFMDQLIMDFKQIILNYPDSNIQIEYEHSDQNDKQSKFRNMLSVPETNFIEQDEGEFQLLYRRCTQQQLSVLKYAEKFIDFLIQLLSSIPTRKYLRLYLLSHNIIPILKVSILVYHSSILNTLVDLLEHYVTYPLNDLTGEPLSIEAQTIIHKDFLKQTQAVLYRMFQFMLQQRDLEEFNFIKDLQVQESYELFQALNLPFPSDLPKGIYGPKQTCPGPIIESAILTTSLIPSDDFIWDYKRIPEENSYGTINQVLAIPKLNLQFISQEDYLERNYWLYKLESAYDVRKDIEDAITRMAPAFDNVGRFTHFEGWARMAAEVKKFKVHHVQPADIGKILPKKIIAEVQYSVERMAHNLRMEWDQLKRHDVIFLVSFISKERELQYINNLKELQELINDIDDNKGCQLFCQKYGIRAIRGGTIDLIYDERRREIQDWEAIENKKYQGFLRILNVHMDTAQYYEDFQSDIEAEGEIYGNFKLIIRRKAKENNFKSILGAIQNIIEEKPYVPKFINDILLGYGNDEYSSAFKEMNRNSVSIEYKLHDTFINQEHFNESFAQNDLIPTELKNKIQYDASIQKNNQIRFTRDQITAIISSLYTGLNLIVGPPGTGKTDVTVQIANLLYHNFRNERTLIITHSNNALNDIFEKISKLDIDEKHLLRLGQGESVLKLGKSYSKSGRIDYMLNKRLQLLQIICELQLSMNIKFAEQFTCELAVIFNKAYIKPAWGKFNNGEEKEFPFKEFVQGHEQLFNQQANEQQQYEIIQNIFHQVEECRALEILRNKKERGNYILCHQSRIVAMTCTHAALKRKEAGQILEIEAFLPMTISPQLKRVTMIGDNNQLPPIVKNTSFQKSANLEQAFFIRMLRLGFYAHNFHHQGRAREQLVSLYEWKYGSLSTLEQCYNNQYIYSNAGFSKIFQFIDVDYQGTTETKPTQYVYQNLEEAELIVATYMYMILVGYDQSKISILTTYNGQKLLIRDIIQRKCAWHSLFKKPAKICTVDKYQGQQNDYILLSMVRTENVGFLRENRRIIVAFSRAKLGLYVFGKYDLFARVPEINKSMKQFTKEGLKLIPDEKFPTLRLSKYQGSNIVEFNQSRQVYDLVKYMLTAV